MWWEIKYSSQPFVTPKIELWFMNCCCCAIWSSFCLLSSRTFRWEFECFADMNVGLAAGRYSGTNRPDLYRTPQALQSVLGPIGPVRHWGVFSAWQCKHFRPEESPLGASFFFDEDDFGGLGSAGERRWRRRVVQSQGAVRDRLLRALQGSGVSAGKRGEFFEESEGIDTEGGNSEEDEVSGVWGLEIEWLLER